MPEKNPGFVPRRCDQAVQSFVQVSYSTETRLWQV